jgi:hypothetical protein
VTLGRAPRRWLVVGAVLLLFGAGRLAVRTFGVETSLPGGVRGYATCKAPWHSASAGDPGDRFTLFVMTGAAAGRRNEGVAALGQLCRDRGRLRMGLAVLLLGGGGVLAWLARPERIRR